MIETLDLLRPVYKKTAAYGHFGRTEKSFTWENPDRALELADALRPKSSNGKKSEKPAKGKAGKKAELRAGA